MNKQKEHKKKKRDGNSGQKTVETTEEETEKMMKKKQMITKKRGARLIKINSYNFPLLLGNNPPLSQFAQFAKVVRYQSDPMSPCLRYT